MKTAKELNIQAKKANVKLNEFINSEFEKAIKTITDAIEEAADKGLFQTEVSAEFNSCEFKSSDFAVKEKVVAQLEFHGYAVLAEPVSLAHSSSEFSFKISWII